MTVRRLLRQWLRKNERDEVDVPDWQTGLARVREAPPTYFTDKACLFGHMWHGWHRFIGRDCKYITVLRDPQERTLSFYWHQRTTPGNPQYKASNEAELDEYLRSRRQIWMDNGQVRQLAGLLNESGKHTVKLGAVCDEHLELAKSNLLSDFAFVGLQERVPEAIIAIGDLLGKETEYYLTRNKTRHKPDTSSLSEHEVAAIKEANRYDIQLYEFARNLYYEQYHSPSLEQRARDLERRSMKSNETSGDSIFQYV